MLRPKISLAWSLLIVGMVEIAFSLVVVADNVAIESLEDSIAGAQNVIVRKQEIAGLPIRLKIPKINVEADIEHVGLTPEGEVGVPEGPTNAAWLDFGPRPGEKGTSIIDGHYGWKDNIPAVFDNLHKLEKGDKVFVEDEKGAITAFVVSKVETYGEHEEPLDVFGSNDDMAHLNLITCGGTWNARAKSYSNRVVVFSDKVTGDSEIE